MQCDTATEGGQTKGRTYTELDELYAAGVSPRHFAKSVSATRETHDITCVGHDAK